MKSRERLEKLRASKSWTERLALAQDRVPGTKFDWLIRQAIDALHGLTLSELPGMPPEGRIAMQGLYKDTLSAIGEDFATAIKNGNSKLFRELADAIDEVREHSPMPDKLRAAIIKFCIPPAGVFSMRKIIEHLCKIGLAQPAKDSAEHDDLRRTVRRITSDLKIKLSRTNSGRPRKLGQKGSKNDN